MRSLVMIADTFYPDPSVGGVRLANWCRMLPALGWKPIVLTRYRGHLATRSLLDAEIHPSVDVRYLNEPSGEADAASRSEEATSHAVSLPWAAASERVKRHVRPTMPAVGLVVPDLSRFFWKAATESVLETISHIRPDVVLTSSPAHSVHIVGLAAAHAGTPWIADFRDPYMLDHRYRPRGIGKLAVGFHRRFLVSIYDNADAVTHAIPLHYRYARLWFPQARERCVELSHVIPPVPAVDKRLNRDASRRVVLVVGGIGAEEVVQLAQAVDGVKRHAVELRIVGPFPESANLIRGILRDRVTMTGPLRHEFARAEMAAADVLVSFLSPDRSRNVLVSSKLFEYVAAGKPVLEINPTVPDRQLLKDFPDLTVLVRPSLTELARSIDLVLDTGENETPIGSSNAERYRIDHSWDAHADRLVRVLEQVGSDG